MKNIYAKFFIICATVLPYLGAAAQGKNDGSQGNVEIILKTFNLIIRKTIPVVFGIAVVFFFWGLSRYILAAASEETTTEGKRIMVGGAIALFVMASIWGVLAFFADDLGVDRKIKGMNIPLIGR